jgi:YbbR domain-containing protein
MKQYEFIKDTDENGKETVTVSNSPKHKLDLIPRLVCLIIALFIWLWMVNLNDTDVTETMVIKINVEGLDTLADVGMMIYDMDKSEITVTVRGSNRDLKKYTISDYTATVDVSSISEVGQHTLPITIKTPSDTSLTVAESEPLNVNLQADFKAVTEVGFSVLVENGMLNYSYETKKNADTITLEGPKTIIDMIDTARYTINGNLMVGMDEKEFDGETGEFPLTFWDAKFNQVVVANGVIKYSTQNIDVRVDITEQKEIPINVQIVGEGSNLVPHPSISTVKISGKPSEIAEVNQLDIEINGAEIGKTSTVTLTNDLLYGNVRFDTEGITVTVRFDEPANKNGK